MIFYGEIQKILKKTFAEFQFKTKEKFKCLHQNFSFIFPDTTIQSMQKDSEKKIITLNHTQTRNKENNEILLLQEGDLSKVNKDNSPAISFLSKNFNETGHITEKVTPPFYLNINTERERLRSIINKFSKVQYLVPEAYIGLTLSSLISSVMKEKHMTDYLTETYYIPKIVNTNKENTDGLLILDFDLYNDIDPEGKPQKQWLNSYNKFWTEWLKKYHNKET